MGVSIAYTRVSIAYSSRSVVFYIVGVSIAYLRVSSAHSVDSAKQRNKLQIISNV